MSLVSVLRNALFVLVPLSFILSNYLYLYPIFDVSCAFPAPEQETKHAYLNAFRQHTPFSSLESKKVAPFRLLALGDPQLEGDSSIPDVQAADFPSLSRFWKDAFLLDGTRHSSLERLRHSLHDLIDFYLDDIPKALLVYRKRLDHIGNDYYLGHIYRTLHWWTKPTHVTVLGDLVGSQWIDDAEFESRGHRFWKRVFNGGEKVSDELASAPIGFNNTLILGEDSAAWKKRIMNVAGNHDVGYAGDMSQSRMDRFTRVFGKPNYELRFQLPLDTTSFTEQTADSEDSLPESKAIPELRIIVLNDMNLDTPAGSSELQDETYAFLNDVITTSKEVTRPAHFTLVLTHIPMHKEAGICVDSPFFDFYSGVFADGVKEQNHLSQDASKGFLEGIFGLSGNLDAPGQGFGRNGLILTGHDHEGCDTYHYINQSDPTEREWQARRWGDAVRSGIIDEPGLPGLREITVRSMMGDFSGNAGFLSLWFDEGEWDWKFEFSNCEMGTQHFWWIVHILDLIVLGIGIVYGMLASILKLVDAQPVGGRRNTIGNGKSISASPQRPTKPLLVPVDPAVSKSLNRGDTLEVPNIGKRSLRKKRSKANLNGRSLSGSPVPMSS